MKRSIDLYKKVYIKHWFQGFQLYSTLFNAGIFFSIQWGRDQNWTPSSQIANFEPRVVNFTFFHSKFNFQQLLFSSYFEKIKFWAIFGPKSWTLVGGVRSDPLSACSPYIGKILFLSNKKVHIKLTKNDLIISKLA